MSLSEKFAAIYPGNEVTRIQISQKSNGELSVVIDVHGMKCWQAERFINNLINIARCPFVMTVIHGYNHGMAILEMVRNELSNRHIVNRCTDNYNRGVTYLAKVTATSAAIEGLVDGGLPLAEHTRQSKRIRDLDKHDWSGIGIDAAKGMGS